MNLLRQTSPGEPLPQGESPVMDPEEKSQAAMEDYYQLLRELLVLMIVVIGFIFGTIWFFHSFNTALNYFLGACTGMVYLRMLARDVERLGPGFRSSGVGRFALFIGLMITATQVRELEVIPIFMGFLTYKIALIIYAIKITIPNG